MIPLTPSPKALARGGAKYPINALNDISTALGGDGESKYPIDAINKISSVLQDDNSDNSGLWDLLYNFLRANTNEWYQDRYGLKLREATTSQLFQLINMMVATSFDIQSLDNRPLIEDLTSLLDRDRFAYHRYVNEKLQTIRQVGRRNSVIGTVIHLPDGTAKNLSSGFMALNSNYHMYSYYVSKGYTDGRLHVYSNEYVNGVQVFVPQDVFLELRLEDSSLTLPNSNSTYKKNVKVKVYLKVIENGEAVDKGEMLINSPGEYRDIISSAGIRIPYMKVNSGGKTSNIEVYFEGLTTDDPKVFSKGDVLGYIGANSFSLVTLPEPETEVVAG